MPKIIAWLFIAVSIIGFLLVLTLFLFAEDLGDLKTGANLSIFPSVVFLMIFSVGLGGLRRETIPWTFILAGTIGLIIGISYINAGRTPSTGAWGDWPGFRSMVTTAGTGMTIVALFMVGTGVMRLYKKYQLR